MRKVTIIIPVIRPESAKRCVEAVHQNAGVPRSQYQVLTREDKERIGSGRMINALVEDAKHELVLYTGDDTVPQPDFLKNALAKMETLPDGWGVVALNDMRFGGRNFATAWLADKRMLPLLDGHLLHEGYWHCFADNELTLRCKELKRYTWADNAKIKHLNPVVDREVEWDDDYKRIYSNEWFTHDQVLFWRRRQSKWTYAEGEAKKGEED